MVLECEVAEEDLLKEETFEADQSALDSVIMALEEGEGQVVHRWALVQTMVLVTSTILQWDLWDRRVSIEIWQSKLNAAIFYEHIRI